MRPSYFVPLLFAAGCFEGEVAENGCPLFEDCSPDTPNGLHFFGADLANHLELDNARTAIGGIQRVRLAKEVANTFVDLDSGYVALENGPALLVDTQVGAVVTLHAVAAGTNHLEIRDADDNTLMDRKLFSATALSSVTVVALRIENSESLPIAFLPGTVRFGIALADFAGNRLVDEGMTLELPGSTFVSWDTFELAAAPVGTTSMMITAGDQPPFTVDLEVVAAVEDIVDDVPPRALTVGSASFVCFEARGSGHFVAGLDWSFTTDNGSVQEFLAPSCIAVAPQAAGEIQIIATAGGVQKTVTYPVAEAMAKPQRTRPSRTTAGERATAAVTSSR